MENTDAINHEGLACRTKEQIFSELADNAMKVYDGVRRQAEQLPGVHISSAAALDLKDFNAEFFTISFKKKKDNITVKATLDISTAVGYHSALFLDLCDSVCEDTSLPIYMNHSESGSGLYTSHHEGNNVDVVIERLNAYIQERSAN